MGSLDPGMRRKIGNNAWQLQSQSKTFCPRLHKDDLGWGRSSKKQRQILDMVGFWEGGLSPDASHRPKRCGWKVQKQSGSETLILSVGASLQHSQTWWQGAEAMLGRWAPDSITKFSILFLCSEKSGMTLCTLGGCITWSRGSRRHLRLQMGVGGSSNDLEGYAIVKSSLSPALAQALTLWRSHHI